jgi:hypothetical protein
MYVGYARPTQTGPPWPRRWGGMAGSCSTRWTRRRAPRPALTQVQTTPATVHEAMGTATSQPALVDQDWAPQAHVVDAA